MNGDESATPQEPLSSLGVEALFGVTDRSALVTGASRGIGRMIAEGLVVNGARVLIAARASQDLERTVSELGSLGSCEAVESDVTTADGRAAIVQAVSERGSLDLLVNNAGMAVPESFGSIDPDAAAAMLELNLTAPLLLTDALLPALRRAADAADPSRVVMIGSVDGIRVPKAPLFTYGASKAALHSLTRQLAHALATDHINVNAIAPGMFPSAMTEAMLAAPGMLERINAAIPAGRIGGTQDITAAVLYLASRAGAYLNGAVIPVDGGVSTTHG